MRLPGVKRLPLPIYALPTVIKDPELVQVNKADYQILWNNPEFRKRLPNQQLMDLQDWLYSEVCIGGPINTNGDERDPRIYTIKDLIFEAASTIGTAHFDVDIPSQLDYAMLVYADQNGPRG